ncbi:hypothetical protein VV02_24080 [Luteipulveratus mongoliensis]|uniref:DUF1990 domain-containing protein n=1 Tax=Luteipulveratus mongoliensis TaxID=571913 RepID=A0A0K1JRC5_9MICO|nr:hypothetical protein VV02_24080 [Luteipulveratus mongoliensis]
MSYERRVGEWPDLPGRRTFRRARLIGRDDLTAAAGALMSWRVHEAAGLRIEPSTATVAMGSVVRLSLRIGRLAVKAPCRVVEKIEDADRVGFAYGTLLGHPESGEELFLLERTERGVTFTVAASSRPSSILARVGGPVTHGVQQLVTSRYLRAFDRLPHQ